MAISSWQCAPRGAAELRHHLTPGVVALRADGILRVSQHVAEVAAQLDRVGKEPVTVRVDGDAGVGEAVGLCGHGRDLLLAGVHCS